MTIQAYIATREHLQPVRNQRDWWAMGEVWEIRNLVQVFEQLRSTRWIENDTLCLLSDVTIRDWIRDKDVRFRGDPLDDESVLEVADKHIEDLREGCYDLIGAIMEDQRPVWDWAYQLDHADDFTPPSMRVTRIEAEHALRICKSVVGLQSSVLRFPENTDFFGDIE